MIGLRELIQIQNLTLFFNTQTLCVQTNVWQDTKIFFKTHFYSLKINFFSLKINGIFIERDVIEFFNFVHFGLMQLSKEIRSSAMCFKCKDARVYIQYIFIIIVTKSCNSEGNSEYLLFLKSFLHSLFFLRSYFLTSNSDVT